RVSMSAPQKTYPDMSTADPPHRLSRQAHSADSRHQQHDWGAKGIIMATITAGMVKDLREKTGAGMMDCKTALTETNGDFEKAVDWLRKKGLARAAKKAGRTAAEGLVGVVTKADCGAVVEVNSETDFVARGTDFQNYVRKAARQALEEEGELERLLMSPFDSGATMADALNGLIAKIGENL